MKPGHRIRCFGHCREGREGVCRAGCYSFRRLIYYRFQVAREREGYPSTSTGGGGSRFESWGTARFRGTKMDDIGWHRISNATPHGTDSLDFKGGQAREGDQMSGGVSEEGLYVSRSRTPPLLTYTLPRSPWLRLRA